MKLLPGVFPLPDDLPCQEAAVGALWSALEGFLPRGFTVGDVRFEPSHDGEVNRAPYAARTQVQVGGVPVRAVSLLFVDGSVQTRSADPAARADPETFEPVARAEARRVAGLLAAAEDWGEFIALVRLRETLLRAVGRYDVGWGGRPEVGPEPFVWTARADLILLHARRVTDPDQRATAVALADGWAGTGPELVAAAAALHS